MFVKLSRRAFARKAEPNDEPIIPNNNRQSRWAAWDAANPSPFALPVEVIDATYDGATWQIEPGSWDIMRSTAVLLPAPTSAVLAMMGFAIVGWVKKRTPFT